MAAATNVKPALGAIIDAFEQDTSLTVSVTYGSTGKLTTQILDGAPFDIFLAADTEGPEQLDPSGALASRGARRPYAIGKLMLWAPDHAPGLTLEDVLGDPAVRYIAVANPDLAPYGRAAMETLDALGADAALSGKLVHGENIGQAFTLVATGNAQAGFIARSQEGRASGTVLPIPAAAHAPIVQDAVLLSGPERPAAAAFFAFLFDEPSRAIFAAHGYTEP
ncbi:MAG: molybdate ABC transporter substrate-binding protein [Pseudomonadota bacterium]